MIGCESAVAAIQSQLASGRIPAAFLLHGPPGCGKTTLARIIAAELKAEIHEMNSADFTGVDTARELAAVCEYSSLTHERRVFILDEAQKLTDPAQQALLKPLEDTAGSTVFIFCTTEPTKLIKALRDRCLAYELCPLPDDLVHSFLKWVASYTGQRELLLGDFLRAVDLSDLRAPREIIMACERRIAGLSPEEAVACPDANPQYINIARVVGAGDWPRTRELLRKLKANDARGLRAVVAAYLKGMLLNSDGAKAQAVSDALLGMVQYSSFEDGVALSATVAVLYRICKKLTGGK
jgi:hypothetical protein